MYGGMHETIGQQQHQGRVELAEVISTPHFYGVGALEGLKGEITIVDSDAVVTGVSHDNRPQPRTPARLQATLLVGQSIHAWANITIPDKTPRDKFEDLVESHATRIGIDVTKPFLFVVEGEFIDLRLHIINGACPMHARMKQIDIDEEQQPFEQDAETLAGTLVGVYAPDAVGKLTHPATRVHTHLVYNDPDTGARVTGHLEQVGLASGAVLKLPDPKVTPPEQP